jgi:phosphoenolpyruvate carboxykinase (GTP)
MLSAPLRFKHARLSQWVNSNIDLCKPRAVHVCDGSAAEAVQLRNALVASGTLIPLNPLTYPNCYLARSTASDVARVERGTFICSTNKDHAGPTNNWAHPDDMRQRLQKMFDGSMAGRTMYVVPFSMGPLMSPYSVQGIQITDSPYAVINMGIMTRMGTEALEKIEEYGHFIPCLHSVGAPLKDGEEDTTWPQNTEKLITHFPETREIISFGSGYGGNALLGKKCLALRIASVMGKEEGWLAEHMLIMGVTNPAGVKKYFAAAFPSACGKTNFAMMVPTLPGWRVEVVGDDIAWIHVGRDGRLRALNPEAGFFGVAPGTSAKTNANALAAAGANSIFTNVAVTDSGEPWWEGLTSRPPQSLTSWLRRPWNGADGPAAHPNSRFTAPASQCPIIDPAWEHPDGVPLDGIIFGGRRSDTIPLVTQARGWNEGVYMGATMMSETTAAAEGARGALRADPFAMLPFCGYNMADYFAHWLTMGTRVCAAPPIFYVNWFRKSAEGAYMWPGFGDNIRVLEWMFARCDGSVGANETPIGYVPHAADINISGFNMKKETLNELLEVQGGAWKQECERRRTFFSSFGERLPHELWGVQAKLESRYG